LLKKKDKSLKNKKLSLKKNTVLEKNILYLRADRKNTRLSFLNKNNKLLFSYTVGSLGFKKSQKADAYNIKLLMEKVFFQLNALNI
jgi:ribosomal protein S11